MTKEKNYTITKTKYFNGLHWRYENKKGDMLSIVCHDGSYGHELGLFETMCSWKPDVQGYLTFKQVAQKIDTFIKLTNDEAR